MMTYSSDKQERRRSQRIPQSVPLFVRRLDSLCTFSGRLHAVEVSSHGCVIHAFRPFPRGTELRLDILHGNRTTTAHVVHSDPIGTGMRLTTWTVALELDKPGNFWMVESLAPGWPRSWNSSGAGDIPLQIPTGASIKRAGRDLWFRQ